MRRFPEITFNEGVRDAQSRYGTREQMERFAELPHEDRRLGDKEAAFIGERDGFYLASVNAEGWPYVQFRGGPKGFLKVLDDKSLGFADFRGNRQYISTGNVSRNDRVALILMDYVNRQRLKVLARARVVELADNAELIERLKMPDYSAVVERGIVLDVEAFDWNCPQHITPKFTIEELIERVPQLKDAIESD